MITNKFLFHLLFEYRINELKGPIYILFRTLLVARIHGWNPSEEEISNILQELPPINSSNIQEAIKELLLTPKEKLQ